MTDYCSFEKRKTKNDKRAKARFNKYKKGGPQRTANTKNTQAKSL